MVLKLGGRVAVIGLAGLLASCGPSQSQIEGSIVDMYENQGAEDIEVDLEPTDGGGYEGSVSYVDDETNERMTLDCEVEPAESGEASWECRPTTGYFEDSIEAYYSERGATNIAVELEDDNDGGYEGTLEFTDPASGQQLRQNCVVNVDTEDSGWECRP